MTVDDDDEDDKEEEAALFPAEVKYLGRKEG